MSLFLPPSPLRIRRGIRRGIRREMLRGTRTPLLLHPRPLAENTRDEQDATARLTLRTRTQHCCAPRAPAYAYTVVLKRPTAQVISQGTRLFMVRLLSLLPFRGGYNTWILTNTPDIGTSHYGSTRNHSQNESWSQRLVQALTDRQESMTESKLSIAPDERIWYDQFTCTDWVHDSIADSYRIKQLRNRKDWRGRLTVLFDGAQGWVLSALVGFLVAVLAYCVNVAETTIFDYKDGYCARAWYLNEKVCCIKSHRIQFLLKHSPVQRRSYHTRPFL